VFGVVEYDDVFTRTVGSREPQGELVRFGQRIGQVADAVLGRKLLQQTLNAALTLTNINAAVLQRPSDGFSNGGMRVAQQRITHTGIQPALACIVEEGTTGSGDKRHSLLL
jgi:hypothetical protein